MGRGMNEANRLEAERNTIDTIADRTFKRLQKAIVEGDIATGSKISEPVLARQLGISRGPLREALSRLEGYHLIERTANVGARVVKLNRQHLIEIYQIRESLEGLAAKLASAHMTDDEIEALQALLAQHRVQIEQNNEQSYFQKQGDMDFHFRIFEGSKNSRLINLYCNDLYQLIRLYRFQFGMVSKRVPQAFKEHEQIVEAIRQRDGELAELLMRRHIRASQRNVEAMLAEQTTGTVAEPIRVVTQ